MGPPSSFCPAKNVTLGTMQPTARGKLPSIQLEATWDRGRGSVLDPIPDDTSPGTGLNGMV
jgi:hypothetical protein